MPVESDKRLLTRLMAEAFRRAVLLPFLLLVAALGAAFDYTFIWVAAGALLVSEIVVIFHERWRHIERNSQENVNLSVEVIRNSWNLRQQRHWHSNYLNDDPIPEEHLIFERPNADVQGSFRIPRLGLIHSFRYRTDALGRRFTSEPKLSETTEEDNRPVISVYGCSCTWGIGVNDEETYPWLLQQEFPEFRIERQRKRCQEDYVHSARCRRRF